MNRNIVKICKNLRLLIIVFIPNTIIINYLEDLEDIRDAEERLNDSLDSYLTIEEMEKKLGLED